MPIVQQRPATIASTAAEGRRRLGGQSPSHARGNPNKHPLPKVRASTASLSPALDGALLPQIVSAPRAASPRKKSVPQHSSHEAPRSPAKRNQKRPSAVPSPASTPRAAAAAAAAAANRARRISRGSDVPPAARAAPASPQLPAGAPTRQRRSNAAVDAARPGQYRRKPIAHVPKGSDLPSKKGAEVAEEEEEEEEEESALSADDALLLCGVQPGSAKALWFTSLLSQLDSRRDLSAALDTADLQEQQRSSTEDAVLRAAAPSVSALPVLHASGVTVVSPPLQLPAKLLEEEEPWQRVAPPSDYAAPPVHEDTLPLASHPDAKPHSSAYESASSPSSSSSSSETASEARSVASHTVHSTVETDDDDDDDDGDEEEDVSDDDEAEETDSASSRDEQHEPRFHRGNSNYHNTGGEDAGDEEGSQLPSPKKFADATKRPMSEAANLLAQLRAAVAHRKSEQLPEGVTELHLRELRLTRQQIEQSRVHVLSLEKEESD